jgi:phage terminase large subunit
VTESEGLAREMATPSGYARLRLGFGLHPKQARVLDDLFSKRKQRVAFLCGNEVGKTSRVAVSAILYALDILRARVQMTSGSDRQLKEQLIPNLKRLSHLFRPFGWEFLDRSIKIGDINQFLAYAARDEGTFQGFHEEAEGGERIGQLIIVDEAAAVRDEIIGAAEDRCNPTWLLIMGSPLDPTGKFYSMTRELSAFYSCHRLSKLDCTTDKAWKGGKGWLDADDVARTIAKNCGIPMDVAQTIVRTGEHNGQIKDPLTLSSVFAEFASFVENALLTLTEYQKAEDNPPNFDPSQDKHIFCDFAGGRAKNVCAVRVGNRVWIEKKWVEPNEMTAVGEFIHLFKRLQTEHGFVGEEISGDGDGLGGPMVRRIQEMGWAINDFHGGSAARFNDRYQDAWTEAWCEGANRIKQCNIILPKDQEFRGQALARKTKFISSGKLKLETKDDMRRRNIQSPDEADAIFCAMMPAPLARSIQFGQSKSANWREMMEEANTGATPTFFQ